MNTHPVCTCFRSLLKGHDGAVVTHSPPTSEDGGSNAGPYVVELIVAYGCSTVYSTEPSST